MPVQQIDGPGGPNVRRQWTLEKIGEEKTTFLEVREDLFFGLCGRGDGESGEEIAGKPAERAFGRIEKFGVSVWGRCSEQEGLDVDGAKSSGPFEPLQAASDVLGGS